MLPAAYRAHLRVGGKWPLSADVVWNRHAVCSTGKRRQAWGP